MRGSLGIKSRNWTVGVAATVCLTATAFAGPLPGAIFTTTENGSRVNANLYEAFDGLFSNGEPVSASLGISGELIAPPGSPKAEVSQFLVDANAGGDPREQLAQQLLAFLFNTLHRLDDPAAAIELPGGGFISAAQLVSDAIAIWESGTAAEQVEMKTLLDEFNNNDAVPFIHFHPCAVVYP